VEIEDEIECLDCGFRWRRYIPRYVKPKSPVEPPTQTSAVRGGGLLASVGYGVGLYLGLAVGYSLILYIMRAFILGQSPGGGVGYLAAVLGALIPFIVTVLYIFLAGPIIAAVVGVFIGIRHRGSLPRSIIATLISSMAGYLLLVGVVTATTASMLPQPETPPLPQPETPPQMGAELLIIPIIPQAFVGVITSAIAAKALAWR